MIANSIELLSHNDIANMREVCSIAAKILSFLYSQTVVGTSTKNIEKKFIKEAELHKVVSSCFGYQGYPAHICTSVNDVMCHGIPNDCLLIEEDVINVDICINKNGVHADCSFTKHLGTEEQKANMVRKAHECMDAGINAVKPGNTLLDVALAVERCALIGGYNIVPDFCGHGIGHDLHQSPEVIFCTQHKSKRIRNNITNYLRSITLQPGMAITIEPIVKVGDTMHYTSKDGWTIRSVDGLPSVQWEHTILVTEDHHEVLTLNNCYSA